MGVDRIVYIRTDGNSQIASGHLVRCFSVAQACKKLGMDVRFLVSDKESASLLRSILSENDTRNLPETEFQVLPLKTAVYNHLDQELPEVTSLLSHSCDANVMNKDIIYFLDSYYVTLNYLTALRPFAKVAYLDDLQLFDYPADLLINYDIAPDSAISSCKAAYQNAGQLLLGPLYTPLRSQFQNRKITVKKQVSDILITTGGSDPYHFCLKLLHSLGNLVGKNSDTKLHIVIGKLNTDRNALYRLADGCPFLLLHENVSDMASLMELCDLAVSASGTTLYELCALGLPAISFAMADNQLTAAKAFASAGAIPYAGDIRTEEENVLQSVTSFVTRMSSPGLTPRQTRESAHKSMRSLVDADGAIRIAQALMKL